MNDTDIARPTNLGDTAAIAADRIAQLTSDAYNSVAVRPGYISVHVQYELLAPEWPADLHLPSDDGPVLLIETCEARTSGDIRWSHHLEWRATIDGVQWEFWDLLTPQLAAAYNTARLADTAAAGAA